jgi:hypothetical protein
VRTTDLQQGHYEIMKRGGRMRKRNAENKSQRALHMAAYQLRTCLRLSNDGRDLSSSHLSYSITLIRRSVAAG